MFENAFNNIDRVMRNDEGLASELDYAEQTSWILFLKYLDDLEAEREDTASLEGRAYTPILDATYRWQAWAGPKSDGKLDHKTAVTGATCSAGSTLGCFIISKYPATVPTTPTGMKP